MPELWFILPQDKMSLLRQCHNNMTDVSNVPWRFSKANFLQYAKGFAELTKSWPTAIAVVPFRSVDAYCGRCRDAIKGAAKYGYDYPGLDKTKFLAIHKDIVVSARIADNGQATVYIGHRDHIAKRVQSDLAAPSEGRSAVVLDCKGGHHRATALAMLLSDRCLKPSPHFIITGVSAEMIRSLTETYDIEVAPVEGRPEHWHII